jgi:hypothetical protein
VVRAVQAGVAAVQRVSPQAAQARMGIAMDVVQAAVARALKRALARMPVLLPTTATVVAVVAVARQVAMQIAAAVAAKPALLATEREEASVASAPGLLAPRARETCSREVFGSENFEPQSLPALLLAGARELSCPRCD